MLPSPPSHGSSTMPGESLSTTCLSGTSLDDDIRRARDEAVDPVLAVPPPWRWSRMDAARLASCSLLPTISLKDERGGVENLNTQ